jgi:hypothetical protein
MILVQVETFFVCPYWWSVDCVRSNRQLKRRRVLSNQETLSQTLCFAVVPAYHTRHHPYRKAQTVHHRDEQWVGCNLRN